MNRCIHAEEYKNHAKNQHFFAAPVDFPRTERGDFKGEAGFEGAQPSPLFGICAASGCPEMTFLH